MTPFASKQERLLRDGPVEGSVPVLLILVILAAPFFFVRFYGTDYTHGTSLALVDLFLVLAGTQLLGNAIRGKRVIGGGHPNLSSPLLLVGYLFMIVSLISGVEGLALYDIGAGFSLGSLLSGTSQYAFIMIFFPVLATAFLSTDNLPRVIRYIGLGYLPPMLLTLLFLPHSTPAGWREMFFAVNRALGSYGNANTFGGMIVILFPFYIYMALTGKGIWKSIGYVSVSVSLICLFLTVAFSGALIFVCLLAANAVLVILWRDHPIRHQKRGAIRLSIFTITFIVVVGAIGLAMLPSILEDVQVRLFFLNASNTKTIAIENLGTGDQRLQLIDVALGLIKSRHGALFFGHGMRQTAAVPAFSFAGPHLDVHLVYLLLWIEGGGILLLLFLAYLALLVRNVLKLARLFPAEALAVGSSVIAIALFGMVYPHMYLRFFWIPVLPAFAVWHRPAPVPSVPHG